MNYDGLVVRLRGFTRPRWWGTTSPRKRRKRMALLAKHAERSIRIANREIVADAMVGGLGVARSTWIDGELVIERVSQKEFYARDPTLSAGTTAAQDKDG